ncbi:peroxisomal (S)-2-hydroxy-acid oxidase GLO3-like [Solanum tuberosum]|uniref:peroxisomal (S)-2-hydroxy-acid oxidase GLO3-like n=1 Tax=Solanum tuberosum TaxID=4113 RepID=UPI00073A3C8A|nr:PREDICTED: peroxisomal (S)-2-hydroxy-acid oxidase GLO3-like [Solanum tuberosum]
MKAIEAELAGVIVSNHGTRQLNYTPATISVLEEVDQLIIYGLAANGESGVKQVIEMLKNELEQTIALAGCCTVAEITKNYVKTEKERFLGRM